MNTPVKVNLFGPEHSAADGNRPSVAESVVTDNAHNSRVFKSMVDDKSAQEIPESSENVKAKGGNVTYEKAPDTDALVSESDRD